MRWGLRHDQEAPHDPIPLRRHRQGVTNRSLGQLHIANANYVARQTGSDAVGAFLINTSSHNQPTVAAVLHDKVGAMVTVTDLTQVRTQVRSGLTSFNLTGLTRLELTFAVLLAAGAGGLVLAAGFAERRRTLAIISVLGGRPRQLRSLVSLRPQS